MTLVMLWQGHVLVHGSPSFTNGTIYWGSISSDLLVAKMIKKKKQPTTLWL
jgi:hypothetical protein